MPTVITPIGNNTFRTMLGLDEVLIGDQDVTFFKPHIFHRRFDDRCFHKLYLDEEPSGLLQWDAVNHKLTIPIDSYKEVEIYGMPPDAEHPEGYIEYNVRLLKKPAGNSRQITLKFESSGFNWRKILPLDVEYDQARCQAKWNDEERTGTYTITPTQITHDATGEVMKRREDKLVNSYKGKGTVKRVVTHELGEIKKGPRKGLQLKRSTPSVTYAHIYKRKARDADGWEVDIEDINLVGDELTFTLPADFVKNATYPIEQAVGVDPSYTEGMDEIDGTGFTEDSWTAYDIEATDGYDSDMVLEVIITNDDAGKEYYGGVRTYNSSIDRRLQLHEAEGGGRTSVRMYVQPTDNAGSGNIEYYTDENTDIIFTVVGYWTNVDFTERFDDIFTGTSSWGEKALTDPGAADLVCHIIQTTNAENDNDAGVRATSSALVRKIIEHEAEGGGHSCQDMMVKADSSYTIDVYQQGSSGAIHCYHAGYFSSEMDFVELWQNIDQTQSTAWEAIDLTAYLDQERTCDFLLTHERHNSYLYLGIRDGDDSATDRRFLVHEAEGANDDGTDHEFTGFGISAKSNASGVVNAYSADATYEAFYLTGYFLPAGAQDFPISCSVDLSLAANLDRDFDPTRDISENLSLAASLAFQRGWTIVSSSALKLTSALDRALTYTRAISPGLDLAAALDRELAATRASSAGLALAAALSKSFGKVIATSIDLSLAANLAYTRGWTIVSSAALTLVANLSRSVGRTVSSSVNLSLAASLDRAVTFTRNSSVGITLAAALVATKGFVKTISTNLSLATSLAKVFGKVIVTSTNLSLASSLSRTVAYTRAISKNLSLAVNLTYQRGWTIVSSAALSLTTNLSRAVTYTRAATAGATLAASLAKSFGKVIVSSTDLSLATTLNVTKGVVRSISTNLSLAVNLSRAVTFIRTTSSNMTLAVNLVRNITATITTSVNLSLASALTRTVGYTRSASSALTAAVSLVATYSAVGVTHYLVTMTTNLSLATSLIRIVDYTRASSVSLSLAASVAVQMRRLIRFIINIISPWRVRVWTEAAFRQNVRLNGAAIIQSKIIPSMDLETGVKSGMVIKTGISRRG